MKNKFHFGADYYPEQWDESRWSALLAGIDPLLETPAGVEVVERWQGKQRILFVLNHKEQSQNIQLGSSYISLFDDQTLSSEVLIEPFGVLLLTPQAISQV